MRIRDDVDDYMRELKQWLSETGDTPPEEMNSFFESRQDVYEEHMSIWAQAYVFLARQLPEHTDTMLDLGCGTGLELQEIYRLLPGVKVTGIDLCRSMLDRLHEKFSSQAPELVCGDYLHTAFGIDKYDAAVSFQTLHHFLPLQKERLFHKIHEALKPGGVYIQADYIACCEEEERLLCKAWKEKRGKWKVPEDAQRR